MTFNTGVCLCKKKTFIFWFPMLLTKQFVVCAYDFRSSWVSAIRRLRGVNTTKNTTKRNAKATWTWSRVWRETWMWKSRSYRWPNTDMLAYMHSLTHKQLNLWLIESIRSTGFYSKSFRNLPGAYRSEKNSNKFGQWDQPPQTQDQHTTGPAGRQRHYREVQSFHILLIYKSNLCELFLGLNHHGHLRTKNCIWIQPFPYNAFTWAVFACTLSRCHVHLKSKKRS